jgi:hypothetical protein
VCDALSEGLHRHGLPEAILTDNGKVFTGRFGLAKGPVRFDRICAENGIRHLLTAPYSPTTTGKIERLHKTMRAELFNHTTFATLEEAQAGLDAWVEHYNHERPHQGIGDVAPIGRFQLARPELVARDDVESAEPSMSVPPRPAGVSRLVDARGTVSVAGFRYRVGPVFAGEFVEVVVRDGLVEVLHRGVLIATHAQRHRHGQPTRATPQGRRQARRPTGGVRVTRIADGRGSISFAGTSYRVGNAYRRRHVHVALVAGSVQLSVDGHVVRVHAARHDPAKEHGAFATPNGRPRRHTSVAQDPEPPVRHLPEPTCRTGTGS